MASDHTPVEAEDNVDEGNSRSVDPPQSDRDLAYIYDVRRSIAPPAPPVCGWPEADPHYNAYPEVRRQNTYEVFGRASSRLGLNRSTDIAPRSSNDEVTLSDHLRDDVQYEEQPKERTPDPQTPPNPTRRPNLIRRRQDDSDDKEMNVAATNDAAIEQNHGYQEDVQGNHTAPDLFAQHPNFAEQFTARNGSSDPNRFQLPGDDDAVDNHNRVLLPSATFTEPDSEKERGRKRKRPHRDVQFDTQARREIDEIGRLFGLDDLPGTCDPNGNQPGTAGNNMAVDTPAASFAQPYWYTINYGPYMDEQRLQHLQLPHVQYPSVPQDFLGTGNLSGNGPQNSGHNWEAGPEAAYFFGNDDPQERSNLPNVYGQDWNQLEHPSQQLAPTLLPGAAMSSSSLSRNTDCSMYYFGQYSALQYNQNTGSNPQQAFDLSFNTSGQNADFTLHTYGRQDYFSKIQEQNNGFDLAVDTPAENNDQQEPHQMAGHTSAQSSGQHPADGGKNSQNTRPQPRSVRGSVGSCKRCRELKSKGSRDRPRCELCKKAGNACEYPQEPAKPQNPCKRCKERRLKCNKALRGCKNCKYAKKVCEYDQEAIAPPQHPSPSGALEYQLSQDVDENLEAPESEVHLRGGGGLSSFESTYNEDEHLEPSSSPVHVRGGGGHHNQDEGNYEYEDFVPFDNINGEELPHNNGGEIQKNSGLMGAAGINKPHSDMSNKEFTEKGQEYLKLRYYTDMASNLEVYKRFQELANELGPEMVLWLEQNAQKKGIVDEAGLLQHEDEKKHTEEEEERRKRWIAEEEYREQKRLFISQIDGDLPDLGYDPLSNRLTPAEERFEARRCCRAAVDLYGRPALRGEDRTKSDLGQKLSSEEFNDLIDAFYNGTEKQQERPAKRLKLGATEATIPSVGPQTPRPSTIETGVSMQSSMQTDSPTSPDSFQTAASDVEVEGSEEGEICLVPTSPTSTAAKVSAKILTTARGVTIDAAGESDKVENEITTRPITPKKSAALPGMKTTKKVFDTVKARGNSRDQARASRTSSPAPKSAEWSWGKAVDASRSYRAIAPKVSTEPNVLAQRNPENSHLVRSDQSSFKGGPIHSREQQNSGSRPHPIPTKPPHSNQLQQHQSGRYRSNSDVSTPGRTSSSSSATETNTERRGGFTSDKPSVRQPPERSNLDRVDSSSRDQAPSKRIPILTTPVSQQNTFSRAPSAPAQSRVSHRATRSLDRSTMSTQSTPSNEDFMTGQQQPPIRQDNSPTPTGRGQGMSGASSSRRLAPPINSSPIKLSLTPKSQPSTNLREVACAHFFKPMNRTEAIAKFNTAVAKNPEKYKHLMIVADLKPDSDVLEISGPLGSNVRGSMREIFPGYQVKARVPS